MSAGVSRRLAAAIATGNPPAEALEAARRGLARVREVVGSDGLATDAAFAAGVETGLSAAAAAAALGRLLGASEERVVEAIAAGLDAGRRVEAALLTSSERRPWASGSVEAWVGAAAAAGRVAGLDSDRQLAALALACTQATGIDPGGESRIRFGKAAADGVEAALLAEAGFTAPEAPIEGRRGLTALTAPGADLTSIA